MAINSANLETDTPEFESLLCLSSARIPGRVCVCVCDYCLTLIGLRTLTYKIQKIIPISLKAVVNSKWEDVWNCLAHLAHPNEPCWRKCGRKEYQGLPGVLSLRGIPIQSLVPSRLLPSPTASLEGLVVMWDSPVTNLYFQGKLRTLLNTISCIKHLLFFQVRKSLSDHLAHSTYSPLLTTSFVLFPNPVNYKVSESKV